MITPVILYNIIMATAVVGDVEVVLKAELLLPVLLKVSRLSSTTKLVESMLASVKTLLVSDIEVRVYR